jgi:hypothetical protein
MFDVQHAEERLRTARPPRWDESGSDLFEGILSATPSGRQITLNDAERLLTQMRPHELDLFRLRKCF